MGKKKGGADAAAGAGVEKGAPSGAEKGKEKDKEKAKGAPSNKLTKGQQKALAAKAAAEVCQCIWRWSLPLGHLD